MTNNIQRLTDFELIQGEYFTITIQCRKPNNSTVDVSAFTSSLKVYQYGNRDVEILSIVGGVVDSNKISFKLSSINTNILYGKLEYVIEVAYSNGDKNMGLGYITMM